MAGNIDTLSRTEHAEAMAAYVAAGEQRAHDIGNRGPAKFTDDGYLVPEILDAYWRHGFYVFEGVIDDQEVAELLTQVTEVVEGAPSHKGSLVDAQGRPALGRDLAVEPYLFVKPLSDPWGGTSLLGGRHPTKMAEPSADDSAPSRTVHLIFGMCQLMPAGLNLYGHPDLLAIAASLNGDDFVPYNDAIFVKQPGLGGSVSWHQDGVTHWDNPNWDEGIHGFNFQVQLHRTTAANALWVLPGSHKLGKIDIEGLLAGNEGSDQLPDAVPLLCQPGDVTIANRQVLHGSFANSSPDPRISMTFGFHRRASVLGAKGGLNLKEIDDSLGFGVVYDEQRVFDRSAVIQLAIDARRQAHPDETSYRYLPFSQLEDEYRYNAETHDRLLVDYNTKDLAI